MASSTLLSQRACVGTLSLILAQVGSLAGGWRPAQVLGGVAGTCWRWLAVAGNFSLLPAGQEPLQTGITMGNTVGAWKRSCHLFSLSDIRVSLFTVGR